MLKITPDHSAPAAFLAVLPSFAGGGAERVTLNLLKGLADKGVPVRLIVFNSGGPLRDALGPGIPVIDLDRDSLRHSLIPLVHEIRRLRPRVVYSTLGYVNIALLAARPLLPVATRVWIREANLPSISLPNSPRPRLMHLGYRLLYPRADRVIATSARMSNELAREFGVASDRLALLCNPVDEVAVRRHAQEDIPPRRHTRRFVAAGRLTHQKGYDRLLDLLAASANRDSELLIAGEGPEHSGLQQRISALGLESRVSLLGFVERPWSLIAGADALVLASRWEGMPNVALEALACGTPVIATPDSGGIAELCGWAQARAVTVADIGPAFTAAMEQIPVHATGKLRPSLLPQQYLLDSTVDTVREWITQDV